MDDNIFQRACLIQLSTSCWQGSRMLEPAVMERIGNSEWLRGRKYLVEPDSLNPIRAVISRARKDLEKSALPFPLTGLILVPKERLAPVDECLQMHCGDYWRQVDRFEARYHKAREIARHNLGDLFNEHDYPLNIREKFGFEWRYLTLDVPGKSRILTPEIYAREKVKFQSMMEETRQLATAALREEFAGIINHMADRLGGNEDGKPKKFKNCMVEKMQEFLDSFDSRNLFDDRSLAELVDQARSLVNNVSPDDLRQNDGLRSRMASEMNKIKEVIDESLEDLLPRRKIRFAA